MSAVPTSKARPAVPSAKNPCPSVQGDIDTTYHTQQRDMFTSGLAAEIGVNAFAVWHAIKSHADFQTGIAWPGIRRLMMLTGLSTNPVQAAIKKLEVNHLLRISKRGPKHIYVARERLDVRLGNVVICTVVVDFVPATMRDRLAKLKRSAAGKTGDDDADVWAEVELIPGPSLRQETHGGRLKTTMRADQIPMQVPCVESSLPHSTPAEARLRLAEIANQMRRSGRPEMLKN